MNQPLTSTNDPNWIEQPNTISFRSVGAETARASDCLSLITGRLRETLEFELMRLTRKARIAIGIEKSVALLSRIRRQGNVQNRSRLRRLWGYGLGRSK